MVSVDVKHHVYLRVLGPALNGTSSQIIPAVHTHNAVLMTCLSGWGEFSQVCIIAVVAFVSYISCKILLPFRVFLFFIFVSHLCVRARARVSACVCGCARACVRAWVRACVRMGVYARVCVCVCVCVCATAILQSAANVNLAIFKYGSKILLSTCCDRNTSYFTICW